MQIEIGVYELRNGDRIEREEETLQIGPVTFRGSKEQLDWLMAELRDAFDFHDEQEGAKEEAKRNATATTVAR